MIFRLIFFCMMLQASLAGIRVTASLAALHMDGGAAQVGLLLSSISFFPMFLAIPVGQWVDRAGARRPIGAACLFFLTASAVPSFSPASWGMAPLYVACIFAGLGFLLNNTVSMLLTGVLSTPKERTQNFAWFATGYAVTGLVMPPACGYLIDHLSIAWAFRAGLICAGIGTLGILLSPQLFPSRWPHPPKKRSSRRPFELMGDARVRKVLIVSGIVSMAWDIQNFMFPVYGHAVGLSASQVGWLIGTFFAASFLVRFCLPWISRRLNEWQCLTFVLVIGAVSYVLFPFLESMPALLALAFLLGVGIGGSQPNVMSLLHSESPEGRVGEAIGIRTMIQQASHSLLPTFFGAVTTVLGALPIFLTMSALMALSANLTVRAARLRRQLGPRRCPPPA